MKKKFLILPIVAIVVAMFGVAVFAKTETPGFTRGSQQNWITVYDGAGNDITWDCEMLPLNFSEDFVTSDSDAELMFPGITSKISALDSKLKPTDFKGYIGYKTNGYTDETLTPGPYKVVINSAVAANDIYIMVHVAEDSTMDYSIAKGGKPTITVDSFSPFYVFKASSKTSPATGEYAPVFIAVASVGLLACGAFFAVKAKKSSKVTE